MNQNSVFEGNHCWSSENLVFVLKGAEPVQTDQICGK